MTTNQLRQNMNVMPEWSSWSVNKGQNHLISCESPNTTCDYAPGRSDAVMNVLCALHMGGGDTNNDSSEISSEVASQCGITNRMFKMTYKAENGQVFTNPNMQKQRTWLKKYDKLGEQGFASVGSIIKPNDIICAIIDSGSGRIIEKTYAGSEIGRVNDSILEYNGTIPSVTISIEYTKIFRGGDKQYMANACKTVVRIKDTNECFRTSDGRVIGANYSSVSLYKPFNALPHICSIYQDLLMRDNDADCSEKIDLGSDISEDLIEMINDLIEKNIYLGCDYLINPLTNTKTKKR